MSVPEILLVEFCEIVDFAVEGDPHVAILVAERLMPTLQIDDREPAMSQTNTRSAVDAFVVRTPVAYRVGHCRHYGAFDESLAPRLENAANSAHILNHVLLNLVA